MRKFCLLFALLVGFLESPLTALPVGNPAEPCLLWRGIFFDCCQDPCADPLLNFRVGFYGDYVFNRYLKSDVSDNHKHIDKARLNTNAGCLSVSLFNRIEAFATFGASDVLIWTNFAAFSPGPGFADLHGQHLEIKTQCDFSWSVGLRGFIWNWGSLLLGAEAQYFKAEPNITYVLLEDNVSNYPENLRLRYREWQVGLAAAYRVNPLVVPYVAVKWSQARVNMHHTLVTFSGRPETENVTLNNLENSRQWGYAVGVSFIAFGCVDCTVEGSFASERALYVNGQIRF